MELRLRIVLRNPHRQTIPFTSLFGLFLSLVCAFLLSAMFGLIMVLRAVVALAIATFIIPVLIILTIVIVAATRRRRYLPSPSAEGLEAEVAKGGTARFRKARYVTIIFL